MIADEIKKLQTDLKENNIGIYMADDQDDDMDSMRDRFVELANMLFAKKNRCLEAKKDVGCVRIYNQLTGELIYS